MTAGRPTLLTPETSEKICENIRIGVSHDNSAYLADICPATLFAWLAKGREHRNQGLETIHTKFLDDVKKASAEQEKRCVVRVEGGSNGWQGSAWVLERKKQFRKHYAIHNPEIDELKKEVAELAKLIKGNLNGG